MRITSVGCYKGALMMVKVNIDEGISGSDEARLSYDSCQNAARGDYQDLVKMVIEMDSFDTEKIYEHLHRHMFWGISRGVTVPAVVAVVDIACWDVKGETLGLPVYKFLGGKTHDSPRACASRLQMEWRTLITKLDQSELQFKPEDCYDAVKDAMVGGYDAAKIDPCFAGLSKEDLNRAYLKRGDNLKGAYPKALRKIMVECIAAARETGGDELDIIIEIHSIPDTSTAVTLEKSLELYYITYYKEPTMSSNPEVSKHTKQERNTPLVTGERNYTRWGPRQSSEDRTLSIAQPDPYNTGGTTEVKKICDMTNVYSIGVQFHVRGGPIAMTAALYMKVVMPNPVTHEKHCANFETDYQGAGRYTQAPENGGHAMNERPGIGQGMSKEAMASYARMVVDQIFESRW